MLKSIEKVKRRLKNEVLDMKKAVKRVMAAVSAAVMMSGAAAAQTIYTGDSGASLWTKAIYTDQVRIYGSNAYRSSYEWPGTSTIRNSIYPACILESGSLTIAEVFGENCTDLLYTDFEKTSDEAEYMKDGDRLLTNYQMTEWNGFLFVLTGGYKTSLQTKTATDASGVSRSFEVASRSDQSGFDSYLYIFDISRGENYGKCRYARWSAAELGLQMGNPYQYMEGIAVDDDYIYILTQNGAKSASNKYSRGLAVFENTVKRGSEASLPERKDVLTSDYVYGVLETIPTSMTYQNDSQKFESYAINQNIISISSQEISLAATSQKASACVWVTPAKGTVGSTKIYYASDSFLTSENSAATSLSSLLSSKTAAWSEVTSPTIRDINVCGDEITFLVTYGFGGKYYKEVFVTDWSNPESPYLLGSLAYEDADALSADSPIFTAKLYTYDGYIYVSSVYGVDTIKKFDYNNISLVYNGKLDFSALPTGNNVLSLAVSGDYLYGWADKDQNYGIELKAKLSSDKKEIIESAYKYGAKRNDCAVLFGGRIYTQWAYAQVGDAARQSCVYVADTNKLMPVSLSVDKIKSPVSVLFKITGSGQNLDAVYVSVNGGEEVMVKTENVGGEDKWSYEIFEAGDYEISFVGASLEGYKSEGTRESVKLLACSKDNILLTTSCEEENKNAVVSINVTNSNEIEVSFIPIVALYGQKTMESVAFGEKVTLAAGESKAITLKTAIPESVVGYKIKTFLIDGEGGAYPIATAEN